MREESNQSRNTARKRWKGYLPTGDAKLGFEEVSTKCRKSKLSVNHTLNIASSVECFEVVVVVGSEFPPNE
jgi:hypothetical protein